MTSSDSGHLHHTLSLMLNSFSSICLYSSIILFVSYSISVFKYSGISSSEISMGWSFVKGLYYLYLSMYAVAFPFLDPKT